MEGVRVSKGEVPSCPFCHDEVGVGEVNICKSCTAMHHLDCWMQHAGCSIHACDQNPRTVATVSAVKGELNDEQFEISAIYRTLLYLSEGAAFLSLGMTLAGSFWGLLILVVLMVCLMVSWLFSRTE